MSNSMSPGFSLHLPIPIFNNSQKPDLNWPDISGSANSQPSNISPQADQMLTNSGLNSSLLNGLMGGGLTSDTFQNSNQLGLTQSMGATNSGGEIPDDQQAPAQNNPKDNQSPVGSTPLGIIKGGDMDGYLAYRPKNADPNNDNSIQYARPLGKSEKGPNGEPMFEFSQGKQGYEGKDQQGNTTINFTDPVLNREQINSRNEQQSNEAGKNMNEKDVRDTIKNHADQFDGGATQATDSIISRDDWKSIAKNDDNPKLNATVQDPAERASMRAVAKKEVKTIEKGDKMSVPDAVNTVKKHANDIKGAGDTKDLTYEKFERVANGEADLGNKMKPKEKEHLREAASKIVHSPLTQDERKQFASGKNHIDDNKYGKANGGPTLFSQLDNMNSSTDNDGRFSAKNLKKIKLHSK